MRVRRVEPILDEHPADGSPVPLLPSDRLPTDGTSTRQAENTPVSPVEGASNANSDASKAEGAGASPPASPSGHQPVLADGTQTRARDVPKPIGPARLQALRDAIRRGEYPRESDVRSGLVRMFDAEIAKD